MIRLQTQLLLIIKILLFGLFCSLCFGQNFNILAFNNLDTQDSKQEVKTLTQEDKKSNEKDLSLGLQQNDVNNEKLFALLAESIDNVENILIAKGRATLINKEIYALADIITYNSQNRHVQMVGNVRIYKGDNLYLQTNQANMYLDQDYSVLEPFYVQDSRTGIWMNAKEASNKDGIFNFKTSIVSGCPISSPAWRINSSSGKFDREKSLVSLWNARVYIGDIPIFYSPYLRFSTETKRSSGLLYPVFGTTVTDGFVYIQPYYLATQNFWDMTFSPQVRIFRGAGINYEFRAIDKHNDKYIFHTKFFNNSDEYVRDLKLLNKYILGFDFKTSKRNFLEKIFNLNAQFDNALYIDFLYMNDLDYLRLDSLSYYINSSAYVSRVNTYAQTESNYFGVNFKYFINLSQGTNSTTFQNLPNLQYHRYLDSLFFKELLYSIDYQFKNVYRSEGYSYLSNEVYVPLGMQFSIFQKYASLGLWANIRAGNIYAHNIDKTFVFRNSGFPEKLNENMGNYIAANYRVSLSADLGRDYKYLFHSSQGSISVIAPFARGVFANGILSDNIINSYTVLDPNSSNKIQDGGDIWDPTSFSSVFLSKNIMNINVANYFYGKGGKELFSWRIRQILNLDDVVSNAKVPMENKISIIPVNGLSLGASVFYSWFYSAFTEMGLSTGYSNRYFSTNISYFLKRDDAKFSFDKTTLTYKAVDSSNYLNTSISGDLGYFGFNAGLIFDFRTSTVLNFNVGIFKDIKCFGVGFKIGSDRTPILTQGIGHEGTISFIQNSYVKVELKFAPLTSVGYAYRLRPSVSNPAR